MNKCSKCGTEYDAGANFCPACGEPKVIIVETVEVVEEQPVYEQPPVQQPYQPQEQPPQGQYAPPQQQYQQPPQGQYAQPQQPYQQQPYQQQPYQQQPQQFNPQYYQVQQKAAQPIAPEVRTKAIVALVLGIVSAVMSFISIYVMAFGAIMAELGMGGEAAMVICPIIAIALGIVAIVMGNKARKESTGGPRAMAITGFALGIVGVAMGGLMLFVGIAFVATISSYGGYYYDDLFSYSDFY